MPTAILKVSHVPSEGKSWVARIGGRARRFGLAREFLAPIQKDWGPKKADGISTFELAEGELYQVQPSGETRSFVRVVDGKAVVVDLNDARKALDRLDAGERAFRTAAEAEIDQAIERVNFTSEGGFRINQE